jgi:transposase
MGRTKKAKPRRQPRRGRATVSVPREEVDLARLQDILSRVEGSGALDEESYETLRGAVDTLVFVTQQLERKNITVNYLRNLLFGSSSEKSKDVLPDGEAPAEGEAAQSTTVGASSSSTGGERPPKKKGHGRNGVKDYPGAERVPVPHPTLQPGACCPECGRGGVYQLKEPSRLVRVRGMAPLVAQVYEAERLRCTGCQAVFTAPPPDGIGDEKYDASATAMVGMLRYGTGMPFNRLEKLQESMGMPVPASTQWDLVRAAADKLQPVLEELVDVAGAEQGDPQRRHLHAGHSADERRDKAKGGRRLRGADRHVHDGHRGGRSRRQEGRAVHDRHQARRREHGARAGAAPRRARAHYPDG